MVGTWLNTKEEGNQVWVKMIIQPDHVGECWVHTYSPSAQELAFKVLKAWVDGEGNTYFQYHYKCKSCQGLGLMKLDKARKVLEVNQKLGKEGDALAEQIERQSPSAHWTVYMVFYRQ